MSNNRVLVDGIEIGPGAPTFVIAEAGINHNGDVNMALRLVNEAANAGCNAIKFQKRNPDVSTPENVKNNVRETPWGSMTYLEYKHKIEFGEQEYLEIATEAAKLGLVWFASPWDPDSVEFLEAMRVSVYKVASASVTDVEVLKSIKSTGKPVIMSTGMSTLSEIDKAVDIIGTSNLILLHTNSSYPMAPEDANLAVMDTLRERYKVPVGYSGHEVGLQISIAAVAKGASVIERHFTLDRSLWGTDQAASLEPVGMQKLVRDIRIVETALGHPEKKVNPSEEGPRMKLRRVQ